MLNPRRYKESKCLRVLLTEGVNGAVVCEVLKVVEVVPPSVKEAR
jgi:hypothetical protein